MTVIGARPQFIKAATLSRAMRRFSDIHEVIVHTGQHFDKNMSDVFFRQLDLPAPTHNLGVSGISHGAMTGRMLEGIERLIIDEGPDWVLVYGDTNSTLAGALAASKLRIPVAHVEAGLRSNNMAMPEEVNRILADRVSTLLLCPTAAAEKNLMMEGFPFTTASLKADVPRADADDSTNGARNQIIINVGDVMLDAVLHYRDVARASISLAPYGVSEGSYAIATIHRQENTECAHRLAGIFAALAEISRELPVLLPVHPRIRPKLAALASKFSTEALRFIDPLPYLEMQRLQMSSKLIFTDSGGVQKEAYFHGIPCLTFRDETEWPETVSNGWNRLVGADRRQILSAYWDAVSELAHPDQRLFGDGTAAQKTVDLIRKYT